MQPPKRAAKAVLGVGGAVGLGTVLMLIGWKVEPVQAQLDKLESRTEARDAELIRRMERIEDKQDKILELIRRRKP
jgi:hypothetical protein